METEDDVEFNLLSNVTIYDPAIEVVGDELNDDTLVDVATMEQEMGFGTCDNMCSVHSTAKDAEEATKMAFGASDVATEIEIYDPANATDIGDTVTKTTTEAEIEEIFSNEATALVVGRAGSSVANPWVICGDGNDTDEATETYATDDDWLSPAKQAVVASAWAAASGARSVQWMLASKARVAVRVKAAKVARAARAVVSRSRD